MMQRTMRLDSDVKGMPAIEEPQGQLQAAALLVVERLDELNQVVLGHFKQAQKQLKYFAKCQKAKDQSIKMSRCDPLTDETERQVREAAVLQFKCAYTEFVYELLAALDRLKGCATAEATFEKHGKLVEKQFDKLLKTVNKFGAHKTQRWWDRFSKPVELELAKLENKQSWQMFLAHQNPSKKRLDDIRTSWQMIDNNSVESRNYGGDRYDDATEYTLHNVNFAVFLQRITGSIASLAIVEQQIQLCQLTTRVCRLVCIANQCNQRREMLFELRNILGGLDRMGAKHEKSQTDYAAVIAKIDRQAPYVGLNSVPFGDLEYIRSMRQSSVVSFANMFWVLDNL